MNFVIKNNIPGFEYERKDGNFSFSSLPLYILNLKDHHTLIELMILYCEGKEANTISSWLGRMNVSLLYSIEKLCITELPKTASAWKYLVRKSYSDTLTNTRTRCKLPTRVKIWNANVKPFLDFMQHRDEIPLSVIIRELTGR